MTIDELNKTDLKDCVKKRILEVAKNNNDMNGTPLEDSIRITYNAYTRNTTHSNKVF